MISFSCFSSTSPIFNVPYISPLYFYICPLYLPYILFFINVPYIPPIFLEGGGLIRSAGGWKEVVKKNKADKELYDERILGGGEFVGNILGEEKIIGKRKELDDIIRDIARKHGVEEKDIIGNSKDRKISQIRKEIGIEAVRKEKYKGSSKEVGCRCVDNK